MPYVPKLRRDDELTPPDDYYDADDPGWEERVREQQRMDEAEADREFERRREKENEPIQNSK